VVELYDIRLENTTL